MDCGVSERETDMKRLFLIVALTLVIAFLWLILTH
jgi:hypothetical protein